MNSPIRISSNIAAGFIGKAVTLVISLAFLPIYIDLLGIAAYGLIGFYTTLVVLLSVLDLGLSTTLNREMARLSTHPNSAREIRDTLRTYEIIYWLLGVILGIIVLLASQWLSQNWLTDVEISKEVIRQSVTLMGFVIALQWPIALYSGALLGLQRQVWLNVILSVSAAIKAVGAVILLTYVQQDILTFFRWQAASAAVTSLSLAYLAWKILPASVKGVRPRFKREILTTNWRFSAGMFGISIVVAVLTQLDKVILSRGLSLQEFGFYSIASTAGVGLNFLVGPIFTSLFPRFTQLASQGQEDSLRKLYHQACQLVSASVLPLSATVIFFSSDILYLWFKEPETVEKTHLLLSLIAFGTTFNSLANLPYALQLAFGWTKLSLYKNIIAVLVLTPLMKVFIFWWGAVGAAAAWILLNASYVFVEVPVMHTRLLRGSLKRWYLVDIGGPMITSLSLASISRWLLPQGLTLLGTALWIFLTFLCAFIASVLVMPATRAWLQMIFRNLGKTIGALLRQNVSKT